MLGLPSMLRAARGLRNALGSPVRITPMHAGDFGAAARGWGVQVSARAETMFMRLPEVPMTDKRDALVEAASDLCDAIEDGIDGVGEKNRLRTALAAIEPSPEPSESAEAVALAVLEAAESGVDCAMCSGCEFCIRADAVRVERERLRLVVTDTNDALFELNHGDHEHIIDCHAEDLPELYREMALAVEKAIDILQVEIHAMIDPDDISPTGDKP